MKPQITKNSYLITNKDGLFYRGSSYGDKRDWTSDAKSSNGAFYYTLDKAWWKICKFPLMFADCEVLKVEQ